jgi:hypothetical protein
MASLPAGGLFADRRWLFSPEPLALGPDQARDLSSLGHRLRLYLQACDQIYRRSRKGDLPSYVAAYLDAGKPEWLTAHQVAPHIRNELPHVIRPDLLLTRDGFALTEIDGVPGGIGLTHWLNRTYAEAGFEVVGGRDGMATGLASVAPGGADIAVADEAVGYRPELEWIASQLGAAWSVRRAEDYRPEPGRTVYRFFELFDYPNLPAFRRLADLAAGGEVRVTPPLKPHLEEKLWSALFWLRPLGPTWEATLRSNHLRRLRSMIPYSWVVDPAPLPHHAVLPRLGTQSWDEVARLSQKDRRLVLKISGFSPLAWGSRSVTVGHDVPAPTWAEAVAGALANFPRGPFVLQEFSEPAPVDHPYFDPATGAVRTLRGRVRLCPYYFVAAGTTQARLGGVLATIAPADKKVIHGMEDAILVPCTVGQPG